MGSRWRGTRGPPDFAEERAHAWRGYYQDDGGFFQGVANGVWNVARQPDIIPGAGVVPLRAAVALDQDLVRAGQDVEMLKIVVAVQRHRRPGGDDRAHDAYLLVVFRRQELDDGSKNLQRSHVFLSVTAIWFYYLLFGPGGAERAALVWLPDPVDRLKTALPRHACLGDAANYVRADQR